MHTCHMLVPLLALPEPLPRFPRVIGALALVLLVGILLILLVILTTFVFSRTARRQRASAKRAPHVPTACEDVWAMHKLPEDLDWP